MTTTPCPECGAAADPAAPGWCGSCGHHRRLTADQLTRWLLPDAQPVDLGVDLLDPDPLTWPDYPDLRERFRDRTGHDESVAVLEGTVVGGATRAVAVVWEFGFLGGSMGVVAGQRIAAAYDHARRRGLPMLLLPATGGARMQEGMASLVQMAATAVAATAHRAEGLLQVAVLRSPTTGGPFASHLNLADVLLAEPGATIGFAGPRVAAALGGDELPDGSHTSAGAREHGLVDDVVPRPDLPAALDRLLAWGTPRPPADEPPRSLRAMPEAPDELDAWAEVQRARAADRPRGAAFLDAVDVAAELRGDRAGADDPAVRVVLAVLRGRRVVVIAMDPTGDLAVTSAGYRKAWRGLALATRLGVPVVTLVDTPGADASAPSEAAGIAHHIARTFAELLAVPTPVIAVVVGEGGSGGALALAVGDRLLVQEHAVFSVIAPEGAAAILHRDRDRAHEVAALLDPTSHALVRLGIADEVVPEDDDPVAAVWAAVVDHLGELDRVPPDRRRADRATRWRRGTR